MTLDSRTAFHDYQNVSKGSNINTLLDKILDCVDRLVAADRRLPYEDRKKVPNKSQFPFIAIIGPSYMGKTQLSFDLAKSNPVIYFNFCTNSSTQKIYSAFDDVSNEMSNCLEADSHLIKGPSDFGPSTGTLLDSKNRTVCYKSLGFLLSLLEYASVFDFNDSDASWMDRYVNSGPLVYSEITIQEFYKKIGINKIS